jgi:biotin carboxyl carrier protein
VPDAGPQRERSTKAERKANHAAIARLTDDLLPALIAKLGSTDLGELEVREGDWHVRLRRPSGSLSSDGRRATDKPSRAQPGHEGHGHGRAAPEGHRGSRGGSAGTAGGTVAGSSSNGSGAARSGASRDGDGAPDRSRAIATSPGVGIFQPGSRAASGTRVRAGDSLGAVNVLGVPQDVLAPADGIVGSMLVEPGMAVEYGQELIRIELTAPAAPAEAR